MNICMNGTAGRLQGELTQSGVTDSCIESLTDSLQQLASRGETKMRIDCNRIGKADLSGLRLLYVWMQCARLRGVNWSWSTFQIVCSRPCKPLDLDMASAIKWHRCC